MVAILAAPKPPVRPISTRLAAKPQKTFTIGPWHGEETGEKIILYGESGMGKTTLASMAPDPVFIGLDDGGRKLHNPITGKELQHILDIENFEDVRSALNACLVLDCKTIVIDTITELERWAADRVLRTIPTPKGKVALGLKHYGWNDGFHHLYDVMRLIVLECDKLIAAGKNVILIGQLTSHRFYTDTGEQYGKEGPQLYSGTPSILELWECWADHVLRITIQKQVVNGAKRATGDSSRIINTDKNPAYIAKTRSKNVPALVSFSTTSDDSIWKFVFGDKYGD